MKRFLMVKKVGNKQPRCCCRSERRKKKKQQNRLRIFYKVAHTHARTHGNISKQDGTRSAADKSLIFGAVEQTPP